jgi:hypothetical protein
MRPSALTATSVRQPSQGAARCVGQRGYAGVPLREAGWRQDASRDFAELKAHHLASIRYGIRVAWAKDKLYYVFRGLELEAAVLGLHERDEAGDIAAKMGLFLQGVRTVTSGDVPDLSEPSESHEDRF